MPRFKKRNKHFALIFIFTATLVFYLPYLISPNLLLNRGNDLSEFFWPIIYFVKRQILINHSLPLWNNLILSGTPLISDPQNPLFYPFNLLFLFFSMEISFMIIIFIHIFIAGIGMYLLAKNIFKFPVFIAIFTTLLYIFSPKLAGFLEAGHVGLIYCFALIPWSFYFLNVFLIKQTRLYLILFSISLSFILLNHVLTFTIILLAFSLWVLVVSMKKIKTIFILICGIVMSITLVAITFLPQIYWIPETTRNLLIINPDVYPKWNSLSEFIISIIAPYFRGYLNIWNLDSEKYLAVGVMPICFSFLGIIHLKKRYAFLLCTGILAILILSLNNLSPFYTELLTVKWYDLLRVTTRFWIILVFFVPILAGYGVKQLFIRYRLPIILKYLILTVSVIELLTLSWFRMIKPIKVNPDLAPQEVYKFLKSKNGMFRVFCVTRCLTQRDSSYYNLELADGYGTLTQTNYNRLAWQFTNSFWNYYTLTIPPIGLYTFDKISPDSKTLGELNVRYVISPYLLKDSNLLEKERIGKFYIYQNSLVKSRAYYLNDDLNIGDIASIVQYTPNHIRLDVSGSTAKRLILSEIYSNGWVAYSNTNRKINVQQRPNGLRMVDIKTGDSYLDFYYNPPGFQIGVIISMLTIFLIFCLLIFRL